MYRVAVSSAIALPLTGAPPTATVAVNPERDVTTSNVASQTDQTTAVKNVLIDKSRFDVNQHFIQQGYALKPWDSLHDDKLPDPYPRWEKQHDLSDYAKRLERFGYATRQVKRRYYPSPEVHDTILSSLKTEKS